jgi:hypothetical protein
MFTQILVLYQCCVNINRFDAHIFAGENTLLLLYLLSFAFQEPILHISQFWSLCLADEQKPRL